VRRPATRLLQFGGLLVKEQFHKNEQSNSSLVWTTEKALRCMASASSFQRFGTR